MCPVLLNCKVFCSPMLVSSISLRNMLWSLCKFFLTIMPCVEQSTADLLAWNVVAFFFFSSCSCMMSILIHQSVGKDLGDVYNFTTLGLDFLICSRRCWTHAPTLIHCGICSQYNLYHQKLWNMLLISISMDCITISKKTVIEVCCQFQKAHSTF